MAAPELPATKLRDWLAGRNFSIGRLHIVVTGFLIVWFGWYFVHPIDLFPADLGRHITNGRILLTEPQNAWNLLHTNFYSYATPTAPFVNHHWLTGVIFFSIWKVGGFVGLGIFHLLVNLATFLLFFRLAVKRAGFKIASLVALATIPLLAERTEIRPEVFSYLLSALYLTILSGVTRGTLKRAWAYTLLPLQILWVNLHIYFFLGFGYIGAYWLATYFRNTETLHLRKHLFKILGLSLLVSLLNPNGVRGLLYPAQIFQNYGFLVSENQSVFEFFKTGTAHANVYAFALLSIIVLGTLFKNYRKKLLTTELADIFVLLFFTAWSYSAIRNFTLFGYLTIVVLPLLIVKNWKQNHLSTKRYVAAALVVTLIAGGLGFKRIKILWPETSLGLVANSTNVANFINTNHITGPLFNDFDIGGYAIFYFFPHLKPFNDNRPEAYPAAFMLGEYVPMQTNDTAWQEALKKYNFNVILYSFEDHAPWATTFIVKRLLDPEWAPVYADNFAIVFLRRNAQNEALIKRFEMSKDRFGLSESK